MKRLSGTMMPILLIVLLLLAACGGEQSMASRSAAAYRRAQATGTPVGGGHEHGDHAGEGPTTAAATTADSHAGMDHGTSPGDAAADHAAHGSAASGVDHTAMGHSTGSAEAVHHTPHAATSRAGAGHEGHGALRTASSTAAHSGMQHESGATQTDPHAQHRQSATSAPGAPAPTVADPHASHGGTPPSAAAANAIATRPPTSGSELQRIQPGAALKADAFDAPAATAVAEAMKATQGGGHEGHQKRGITPGEDRESAPTPMPATRDQRSRVAMPNEPAATSTLYTCPMHPEVTSDEPGTCPKCGMTLVKKN